MPGLPRQHQPEPSELPITQPMFEAFVEAAEGGVRGLSIREVAEDMNRRRGPGRREVNARMLLARLDDLQEHMPLRLSTHRSHERLKLWKHPEPGRPLELTDAGRQLLRPARDSLRGHDEFKGRAREMARAEDETICLVAMPVHAEVGLARVCSKFINDRRNAGIRLRDQYVLPARPADHENMLFKPLRAETVDFAFGGPPRTDLKYEVLYTVKLVVVVSDEDPWRDRPSVDLEALRLRPLVLPNNGHFSRSALDERLGSYAAVSEGPTAQTVLTVLRAGWGSRGAAAVLADDALPLPEDRPYPVLHDHGQPITRQVCVHYKELSPAAERFLQAVKAYEHWGRQEMLL